MKEDSFNFTLIDFLAYLFPGTMMLLAIVALLGLSPYKHYLVEVPLNLVTGLILIACAYFIGVSMSSLMYGFENNLFRYFKLSSPTSSIQLEGFEEDVRKAFSKILGEHGEWSRNHFYLARVLVRENVPSCAVIIERQASLRQIRRNSVLPVLFLGIAGGIAGVKIIPSHLYWGIASILVVFLTSYVIARALIKNGMQENRRREVREVCCGLIAYSHGLSQSDSQAHH